MKLKLSLILQMVGLSAGLRLSIAAAELAGATLPLIPAAAVAIALCGGTGFLLFKSCWKFIQTC